MNKLVPPPLVKPELQIFRLAMAFKLKLTLTSWHGCHLWGIRQKTGTQELKILPFAHIYFGYCLQDWDNWALNVVYLQLWLCKLTKMATKLPLLMYFCSLSFPKGDDTVQVGYGNFGRRMVSLRLLNHSSCRYLWRLVYSLFWNGFVNQGLGTEVVKGSLWRCQINTHY